MEPGELFWSQLEYRINSTLSEQIFVRPETMRVFNQDLYKVMIFLLLNGNESLNEGVNISRLDAFNAIEHNLVSVKKYLILLIESYDLMNRNLLVEKLSPISDLELIFKIVVSLKESETHLLRSDELKRIKEYVSSL